MGTSVGPCTQAVLRRRAAEWDLYNARQGLTLVNFST